MELLLEKFKINNKCQLNSEDISSLTLLYLPLIGLDSYALYSTLTALEKDQEYFIKKLIYITNISTLKGLTNAFDKLEGIGLLKTFYNEEEGYIFNVIKPLSENEFLKEDILVGLLETQIGSDEVNVLRNKYKPVPRKYKDVTKNLSDVFSTSVKSVPNLFLDLIKPKIEVNNPDFNYTLFKMLFDSTFITEEVLSEENFKRMIIKISFVYKLNEDEMKDVVFKSLNNDQRCDYPSLSKYARISFQQKYKVDTPKLVSVKDDQFIQSESDDLLIKLCNDLESMSPSEVLENLSGAKPAQSELKIFEDLAKNTNLTNGAINFMIMMVNNQKDGVLPGYNYFEKIASTWLRAKVKNAYDAYKYMERLKAEKDAPKTRRGNKRVAPLPDWYAEYEKNLQHLEAQPQGENLSGKELEELAKKLFED